MMYDWKTALANRSGTVVDRARGYFGRNNTKDFSALKLGRLEVLLVGESLPGTHELQILYYREYKRIDHSYGHYGEVITFTERQRQAFMDLVIAVPHKDEA